MKKFLIALVILIVIGFLAYFISISSFGGSQPVSAVGPSASTVPAASDMTVSTSTMASSTVPNNIALAKNIDWSIGGEVISLISATTSAEQELGLGQRTSLPENEGMLFVFPMDGDYAFWMKDMQFPLDIIWLDKNLAITHIESDLLPSTYPQTFSPDSPSRYVIEVNAGMAKKYSLVVGETLNILHG